MNQQGSRASVGSTSSGLIERVKAHDQDAWRRLVRLYGPLVNFWIRRAGFVQDADADDVFQEVFTAVARAIGRFHRDRPTDTFRGWLRIITRSKLIDHQRRRAGEPQGAGGSDAHLWFQEVVDSLPDDATDAGDSREVAGVRRRAVAMVRCEFEERTWQAFWRVTVEGEAVLDVAADLGVTPSAVRLAKSRVLRRLRDALRDLEP